ncbi:MAG: M28 family peptidase [Blastocatellia bacterium]
MKSVSPVTRGILLGVTFLLCLSSQAAPQQRKRPIGKQKKQPAAKPQAAPAIPPDVQSALDRISADSLRGHLSFIASDLLEGRNTPSRGLDIAAEYIAAQFRRAGLEPAGDAGEEGQKTFFQTADWRVLEPNLNAFDLTINDGSQTIRVQNTQVSFAGDQQLELKSAGLLKVEYQNAGAIEALKAEQAGGKVIITEIPDFRREDRSKWGTMIQAQNGFVSRMKTLGATFILSVDRSSAMGRGLGSRRLLDPERQGVAGLGGPATLFMTVHDPRVAALYDAMSAGESKASVTLTLGPSEQKPVKLRNVAGLLRGSDPALRDSYVIVSAHYDHIGIGSSVNGDAIYNGANDDGSGTVSVIELASALTGMKRRPKRSIVFIAWFGEERGLLGSRFYGRHPVFPLAKTVAMVNLEQVGRTDSTEGPQLNNASMTGYDFTDLGPIFKAAGEKTGITVYKHERNSDAFFGRSDNQALADAGIPAHTLCTAFEYPDYHGAADHWEKVDYENMARVNRMIALALVSIADNAEAPKWNEANPKTARYVRAWKALHGK